MRYQKLEKQEEISLNNFLSILCVEGLILLEVLHFWIDFL